MNSFPLAKPKSQIEQVMFDAAQVPGPSDYGQTAVPKKGRTLKQLKRAAKEHISRATSDKSARLPQSLPVDLSSTS